MIFRFALINAGVLYIYFTNFQKIDEEEYGGPWELTKEGFIRANLKIIKLWLFSHNQLSKTINKFILFTKLIHHHTKTGNKKKKAFHS